MASWTERATAVVLENGGKLNVEEFVNACFERAKAEGSAATSVDSMRSTITGKVVREAPALHRVKVGDHDMIVHEGILVNLNKVLDGENPDILEAPGMPSGFVASAPRTRTVTVEVGLKDGEFYGVPVRENSPEMEGRELIPKPIGYVEGPSGEMGVLAEWYMDGRESVNLVGPTGCGKTAAVKEFGAMIGQPVIDVECTRNMREHHLVGGMRVNDEGTYWQDGPLTTAMRNGYILILDELNMAAGDITAMLHPVMDSRRSLLINQTGETVHAHPDFFVVAGMNPKESYAGAKELNMALGDRFGAQIEMDYLPEDLEIRVVMDQSGIDDVELATLLVRSANMVREARKSDEVGCDISTRSLIRCLKSATRRPVKEAIRNCIVGRIDAMDQAHVWTIFNTHFDF